MEKTEVLPDSFILPLYGIIATLIVLIDKSELKNNVKTHCKTGLKVMGIIYADKSYNTGTHLLYQKEYDGFFTIFPIAYFNNRELISANTIVINIELCVKTNSIAAVV